MDYDGLCIEGLTPLASSEVGHPAYQHPQRLREGTISPAVDRFSHLVIYTALRALAVGGRGLWERYDTGDNLLFRARDFEAPGDSPLLRELLESPDPEVSRLAMVLRLAAQQPLERVPLLEADVVAHQASLARARREHATVPAPVNLELFPYAAPPPVRGQVTKVSGPNVRRCPNCAEKNEPDAGKCTYCGRPFTLPGPAREEAARFKPQSSVPGLAPAHRRTAWAVLCGFAGLSAVVTGLLLASRSGPSPQDPMAHPQRELQPKTQRPPDTPTDPPRNRREENGPRKADPRRREVEVLLQQARQSLRTADVPRALRQYRTAASLLKELGPETRDEYSKLNGTIARLEKRWKAGQEDPTNQAARQFFYVDWQLCESAADIQEQLPEAEKNLQICCLNKDRFALQKAAQTEVTQRKALERELNALRGVPGEAASKRRKAIARVTTRLTTFYESVDRSLQEITRPVQGTDAQRNRRVQRWTMKFNTFDGNDYLNQLRGLGAILAIPDGQGGYLVIRNLTPPVRPEAEDLRNIHQVFWVDSNAQSVRSLAQALGLPRSPGKVVVFFPASLEKELLAKELAYRDRREQDIKGTVFEILNTGGRYTPRVVQQTPK